MVSNFYGVTPEITVGETNFPRRTAHYLDFRTKLPWHDRFSEVIKVLNTDENYMTVVTRVDDEHFVEETLEGQEYEGALSSLQIFDGCNQWKPFDVTPYIAEKDAFSENEPIHVTRFENTDIFAISPHCRNLLRAMGSLHIDAREMHNAVNAVNREISSLLTPLPRPVSTLWGE